MRKSAKGREPAPEETKASSGSLAAGRQVIRAAVATLPVSPGVYRMIDAKDRVLYVGKAKSLRKRVASYTNVSRLPNRLCRMIARTARVEVVATHTEIEALLLEANMIRRLAPTYNILLRDDKSFPYILVTADHAWPQITKHRGARRRKGDYFGPFASAGAVNKTLAVLQRAFPLRSCSDGIFAGRTRPCLQFQIKRCTAPCCGRINESDYQRLVNEARDFLSGRNRQVQESLLARMQEASAAYEYESAAAYRDRMQALNLIQANQEINVTSVAEADVVAIHQDAGETCVQVFFFRAGCNYGNRAYFPAARGVEEPDKVLAAFLGQFYQNKEIPRQILVSHKIAERALIEEALSQHAGRRVRIHTPLRGDRRKLIDHAVGNARLALARKLSESAEQRRLLDRIAERLDLESAPRRIEIYDNSHISGSDAVGCMVVAGPEGFIKNAYRRYTIKTAGLADDYAMMREVLGRRFGRLLKDDPEHQGETWPDLVILDGGAGQLAVAAEVLADLGVHQVPLIAIAKGPMRNAGLERIHRPELPPLSLNPRDPVLYFLQRLRDEAHRFAIGTHRARRAKAGARSRLDEVPGVGRHRKRALLNHFGSASGVAEAGFADLEKVTGINRSVAKVIYDHFHTDE